MLEEFLTKKLKYSSEWHPTVLKYKVLDNPPYLFKKDDLYFERIGNALLKGIPVYNIRNTAPYITYSLEGIMYTLGEEFSYWNKTPLLILNTKGSVVTECIPNIAIGPFLTGRRSTEWWINYLLDGNNFLTK